MPAARRMKPSRVSALGHPETYVAPANPWEKEEKNKAEMNRITAGQRRKQENEFVASLAKTLPFPEDVTSKLDKASILRLVISYLQMSDCAKEMEGTYSNTKHANRVELFDHDKQIIPFKPQQQGRVDESDLMLDLLNGFVMFVSVNGNVLYCSENVCQHLGLNQVDMIGHAAHQFIHPDDKGEVLKQLLVDNTDDDQMLFASPMEEDGTTKPQEPCSRRFFYVRMKCFYLRKGIKTRQPGFMLVQWSGHLKMNNDGEPEGLICICRPLQPTPILEIRMDGNMFMSRHSMDLKFTFCDPRISTLLGYEPEEIVGQNAYMFHNPVDAHLCMSCHNDLMTKGSSMSKYYRFLAKTGKWVWMQTRASVICNTHNEPQYVVCMNYIVGEKEGQRSIKEAEEKRSKVNRAPNGTQSQYPHDTCSIPGYIDLFHSESASSSSDSGEGTLSPISDRYASSPESVFDSCDASETGKKRLRSNTFSSTSLNSEKSNSFVREQDKNLPDSTTTDTDVNEVRLTVHTLVDNDDIFQETPHSTGRLSHTASDQMWPLLNDLINNQTDDVIQDLGHVQPLHDDDIEPMFAPSPSSSSEPPWGQNGIGSVLRKSSTTGKGAPFGKLRSLFQLSGLNEIPIAQNCTSPSNGLSRLDHGSPDVHMKNVATDLADVVARKLQDNCHGINGVTTSTSNGYLSPRPRVASKIPGKRHVLQTLVKHFEENPEPQLDEIMDSFNNGISLDEHETDRNGGQSGSAGYNSQTTIDNNKSMPRKASSKLEALLKCDNGRLKAPTTTCSMERDSVSNTRIHDDNNINNNNPASRESLLKGLLVGQVKPAEAHRVAINEHAPTFMSKSTTSSAPLRNVCHEAHCGEIDQANKNYELSDPLLNMLEQDPTLESLGLSLQDSSMLDVPECSDWSNVLGPLSPRSKALVEEAESILFEVDRQETQLHDYWYMTS